MIDHTIRTNDLNIFSTISFVKYMRIKLQSTAAINHKVVVLAGAFNIRNIRRRGLFPAIREEGDLLQVSGILLLSLKVIIPYFSCL